VIIRNYASNLIFFTQLAASPPQRGKPMTFRSHRKKYWYSVYHMLSRFLPFTGAIADIHNLYLLEEAKHPTIRVLDRSAVSQLKQTISIYH